MRVLASLLGRDSGTLGFPFQTKHGARTGRPLLRDSLKDRFSTGSFSIVFSDGCDGACPGRSSIATRTL
jgi:hypothetical protein